MAASPVGPNPPTPQARLTNCPDCMADLAVLRIIPGRAGADYWTMRCTRCGGIHLDIIRTSPVVQGSEDLRV
jgi:hypothetical protein